MLRWFMRADSRASPRKSSTNSLFSVRWGRTFLTTRIFSNPAGPCCLARKTSPMPPAASFFSRKYLPKYDPTSLSDMDEPPLSGSGPQRGVVRPRAKLGERTEQGRLGQARDTALRQGILEGTGRQSGPGLQRLGLTPRLYHDRRAARGALARFDRACCFPVPVPVPVPEEESRVRVRARVRVRWIRSSNQSRRRPSVHRPARSRPRSRSSPRSRSPKHPPA